MITTNEYVRAKSIVEEFEENYLVSNLIKHLDTTHDEFYSKSQRQHLNIKRQAVCKYLREVNGLTYMKIADIVGVKHPAVFKAIQRINDLIKINDKLAINTWDKIKDKYN